jgi:ribosomal protein S18 acetylase RimI-like enzyme
MVISDNMVIRELRDDDSLEELTGLLHRSYKALADMGLYYFATHQTVEQTRKRISDKSVFVAVRDSTIIGTILYLKPGKPSGAEFFERPDVAKVGQLAVEPDLQRQGIATQLMHHVEEVARGDGASELSLDTAESASHLIEWYKRLGYRFVEYVRWDVTNYRSVILSKALVDG